eukprot:GHVP01066926.1.p1 GENE.GHVP01066926.1~~GHVP01066926.1.p1  ORF type:complete len:283 (+),score=28.04 GHVP01066926.1:274-1122(+)
MFALGKGQGIEFIRLFTSAILGSNHQVLPFCLNLSSTDCSRFQFHNEVPVCLKNEIQLRNSPNYPQPNYPQPNYPQNNYYPSKVAPPQGSGASFSTYNPPQISQGSSFYNTAAQSNSSAQAQQSGSFSFSNPQLQSGGPERYMTAPQASGSFVAGYDQYDRHLEQLAFAYTNSYRASMNLQPLYWDERLRTIGTEHSHAMAAKQRLFGHDGVRYRFSQIGRMRVGENVGMNKHVDNPAYSIVNGWIKSPSHQKNLVGNYNFCGISVLRNARNEIYFTQLLST